MPAKFGGAHETVRQRPSRSRAVNRESILVQRLVRALDDSRSLYEQAVDKVVRPKLRDLLECTIGVHWLIADDLARHIGEAGDEVTRQGSRLGPLRNFLTRRSARISLDTDMAYANFAAEREAEILRGLHEAASSVRHARLRNRLQMHCRKIERVSTGISRLRTKMQLGIGPAGLAFPKRVTAR
jgi:hypothetical protein